MARAGTGRGRRVAVTLLVVFLLIVGLLISVDRIAVNAAESRIADQTRKELVNNSVTTPADPRVSIAGFPFLTQVLAGEYQKISIGITRPEANGVRLDDLKLDAVTVRADTKAVLSGTGKVTADKVTGTATMSWNAVREALVIAGLPVGIDPAAVKISIVDNKVELRIPIAVAGLRSEAVVTGGLRVADGTIQVRVDAVTLAEGSAPPAVQRLLDQLRSQLKGTVKVPAMPFKLAIDRLETRSSGVFIVASASDVVLAG